MSKIRKKKTSASTLSFHLGFALAKRDAILIIRALSFLSFFSIQMTDVIDPLERPRCSLAERASLIASRNAIPRGVRIDSRRHRRKIAPGAIRSFRLLLAVASRVWRDGRMKKRRTTRRRVVN